MKRHVFSGAFAIFLAIIAIGCSPTGRKWQPTSHGKAYEVVVFSTDSTAATTVERLLTADAEGLPQAEPAFDVSLMANEAQRATAKKARCLVVVNIEKSIEKTAVKYKKNVYSQPQMVVYISAPSAQQLNKELPQRAKAIRALLTRSEMNNGIALMSDNRNKGMQQRVAAQTGCEMLIPADITAYKTAKNFIWMQNNAPTIVKNLCVYTYPARRLTIGTLLEKRDSTLAENIRGALPSMFFQTVKESLSVEKTVEESDTLLTVRGLWEMKNDIMGGPFVAHAKFDRRNNSVKVAEAFLYAPETNKRNLIRLLEAVLYTLN